MEPAVRAGGRAARGVTEMADTGSGDVAPAEATSAPSAPVLHHVEQVMGTVVTIDLYGDGSILGRAAYLALAAARASLRRADAVFSTYKAHSPLSEIRRGALTPEQAPPEVAAVLERCRMLRRLTDGLFDPWAVPGGLDPSGYVKGWAAGRALAALAPAGARGALVNAAGDIALSGAAVAGEPWRVGIVDPHAPRRLLAVAEVTGAIATSGTYERGAHLVDPRSGSATAAAAAATVVGPDPGDCDALATALTVGGPSALDLLDRLPGYFGLVVSLDGTSSASARFPFASTP